MQLFDRLMRLVSRFRYPVSLPEDLAHDLGMHLSNTLNYQKFLQLLAAPHHRPTKLRKSMPRSQAEEKFKLAIKKEVFKSSTLFSYYFNKSWLVVTLYFDRKDCLRRLYVQCSAFEKDEGIDIPLAEELYATPSSH